MTLYEKIWTVGCDLHSNKAKCILLKSLVENNKLWASETVPHLDDMRIKICVMPQSQIVNIQYITITFPYKESN